MKRVTLTNLMAVVFVATAWSGQAADSTAPIAAPDLVFDEVDGIVVVEAEHFHKQTLTDKRAWHITSSNSAPDIQPDADPPHVAGASGGAYLDIIAVTSTIASADGKEHSRARWARISFTPADDATKAAAAKFDTSTSSASAVAPAKPLAPLVQPRQPDGKGAVEISGELKEWHKVTLTLDGPYAHELDNEPNPFTDYDFAVTFTHESGAPSYRVPGYFAADGHAGENSAEAGTKWRAHLSPDTAGTWEYSVSFTRGKHAALDGGGAALKPFDGMSGSFRIAGTDKQGLGHGIRQDGQAVGGGE